MLQRSTLGSLVAERPSRSRVFQRYGIDYCCQGSRTLAQACEQAGLGLEEVEAQLVLEPAIPTDRNWNEATIAETVEHLLRAHHDWLKAELPRIQGLCQKVARVHGSEHPVVEKVLEVFEHLKDDMESHLQKEEIILFPSALHLESTGEIALACHGPVPTLEGPVGRMEEEHQVVGRFLEDLKDLTDGHTPPAHACGTWKAAWDGLRELDENTRAHVHLENEVLHPAIRRLEAHAASR